MEMRFKSYAMFLSATMLLASCAGEDPWREAGGGKGTIVLNLTASDALDNLASQGRADETATIPNFPTVDQFSIRLTPVGGTPIEYATVAEFEENMEAGVKAGAYTIEAYYGAPSDQGDKPYVTGSQTLRVTEQTVTKVDLTAKLANSLVQVTYTDAFKSYFKNYSTTLSSDKNTESVTVTGVDGGSKFVTPGYISVTMAATYINGKEAHLNPKNFSAEAAYMYRVKYDVNAGQIGNPVLSITFDDALEQETVEVDLSDDFFSSAAPEITAEGFASGETVSAKMGAYAGDPLRFNISADGGIKSAVLTVTSEGTDAPYAPAFGTSVELVNAADATQGNLKKEGVTAVGFFKNPDKIAMVDVTDFINNLPEGTHKISLTVTDNMTRVCEPVELTFATIPVTLTVNNAPQKQYYEENVEFNINYDGGDLSKVSFKTVDEFGMESLCNVGAPIDKGGDNYVYTLKLPVDRRTSQPVSVYYNGKKRADIEVKVVCPSLALATDVYTKTAYLKVDGIADEDITRFQEYKWLDLKDDDDAIVHPVYDGESKLFVYNNLEFGKTYQILGLFGVKTIEFTPEEARDVPNGNFISCNDSIKINIDAGGKYKYGRTTMQNKTTISYREPSGWATINQKTCYTGSDPLNTWFVVPSTIAEEGKVTLRNVAYDHNGTLPDLDDHGLAVRKKYSRNAPAKWSNYAAGELFLGDYSFNGAESRIDGISFNSRPKSVSVSCSYTPVSEEKGDVYIAVLDASGNILSNATTEISKGENQSFDIDLPDYKPFGAKAAKLILRFRSSSSENPEAPKPSNLEDVSDATSLSGQTIGENKYKSLCTGSTLVITNVHLNYDK